MAGRAAKAASASPMKPSRQIRRAASICASRPGPAASASLIRRRQVAASGRFLSSPPGATGRPSGR